jgi:vitamin B12 transporter
MQNSQQHHRRAHLAALLLVLLSFNLASAQVMPQAKGTTAASPVASTSTNATPVTTGTNATSSDTKLPTIYVTAATRTPQPPETTATTTTVITNQQLQDGLYASVPDALQSVPGMSVVTGGPPGSQTSVFIHGLDSRQTLITIDGRRQAAGLSGTDDNLANLTLDNVDQIEVVRTPISSIDGGSAMGGVINIVTLNGKGLTTPEGSVSFEAGSFNTYRENIQSRGAVQNFDYAVSASRQDSIYPALSPGSTPLFTSGFTGQADQYRNSTYRGNFGYQITPDIYLDLHTAYNNAYTSVPGEFTTPDPTANLLIEDWNLSPEIVAKVTDWYTTRAYYTHDQQRQAFVDTYNFAMAEAFGYSPQGDINRTQINTESADWQNDFQIARNWSITAGVQADSRNFYVYDDGLGYDTISGNNNNIGGYISSQWQPLPGLNILNSGRYDSYSQFGGAFSWRQGASYRVAPTRTLLHASVSSAFTPPSIQDLYFYYPSFPSSYLPNPNLQPETDLGWEAGVEQPFLDGKVTPGVTYFRNSVKNSIQNIIQPDGNFMEENVGRVTTEGVEINLALKPCDNVTADLGYTYLNADNNTAGIRLVRRPRSSFQFTATWQPVDKLTLTLGGNWIQGRQDIDAVSFVQEPAPDYFVVRAGATYKINDHVSIWVRGENLGDSSYQPVLGYYAPSIAGYGGVKISF